MKKQFFENERLDINYVPNVPTTVIKGTTKVKIEIDDYSKELHNYEFKRMFITCFDFEVDAKMKQYANRKPIIVKTWSLSE